MKDKKTKVRLRPGHPNRVMLARLADDTVISIDESGVDIAPELISKEMTRCGWFETGDGPVVKAVEPTIGKPTNTPEIDTDAGSVDTGNDNPEIGAPLIVDDQSSAEDGVQDVQPVSEPTKAEKAALKRAELEAAKAHAKAKADADAAAAAKKKKTAPVKTAKQTAKPKACKKGK